MEVGDRYLSCWNQEEVVCADDVELFLELGKLTRSGHRRAVHDVRRRDFEVAVIPGVEVQHEVLERPHQPCTHSGVDRKSRSRDLGTARQVKETQSGNQLPMRLRGEWR